MRQKEARQMGTKNKKEKPPYKWDFAIGTTSRVPGCKGFHYLILDIDGKDKYNERFNAATNRLDTFSCDYHVQETEHGFHVYTNLITSLQECALLAGLLGADRGWIRIAESRGYFYLADKKPVNLEWPVERMIIYAKKKGQTSNTGTS